MWDVEMANRTQLAVATNRILWESLRRYDSGTRYRNNLANRYGQEAVNESEDFADLSA